MLERVKKIVSNLKKTRIVEWFCKHSSFSCAVFFSFVTILLYSFLCFHENIWYDEAYQMVLNRYSLKEIVYFVSKDFSPPLYAICLKIFTSIFGSSLGVCRFFSLLVYCFSFFLAFFPIQKLFNKKVSFCFSIFLLLLPVFSYVSLEIRTYCFAFVFTLAAVVYGSLLLKEDSWKNMILYTLFSVLAMYSHNYSIFCIFIFLWIQFICSLFRKKSRFKCFLSLVLVLVSFMPWLSVLLGQAKALNDHFWIETPNLAVLFHTLYFIFGSHKYLVLILIDLFILFLFLNIFLVPKKTLRYFYVLLPSVLTLLFFILWSIFKTPMFITRYIVPVLGGIILFLACICSFSKKNLSVFCIAILLLYPFGYNYLEELEGTDDSQIKNMISYINFVVPGQKKFFHIGEFSLGEMEYYFPGSEHYYYEDVPIYVTVPEIFGDIYKLSSNESLQDGTYVLVSQLPLSDFVREYGLYCLESRTFPISYQGDRYVYILKSGSL